MEDYEIRDVTDSRVLAAMTHPLRRRLLSLLKLDGPSTASVLAQRTGQAVGNISHPLHALAAADLIEEVPELARDRRERWWRRTLSSACCCSARCAPSASCRRRQLAPRTGNAATPAVRSNVRLGQHGYVMLSR